MKRIIIILALSLSCMTVSGDSPKQSLAFLIRKSNWESIPTNVKQQGKAILQSCTDAPIPLKWNWLLQVEANTNVVWGFAVYNHDAWMLRRKEQISPAKIQQIKDKWESYGGVIQWTTNFWQDVNNAGLEMRPSGMPIPE